MVLLFLSLSIRINDSPPFFSRSTSYRLFLFIKSTSRLCTRLTREYRAVIDSLPSSSPVTVYCIKCDHHSSFCSRMQVHGVPQIILTHGFQSYRLDGWRSASQIASFLENHSSLLPRREESFVVEPVFFPDLLKLVSQGHCVAASIYDRNPPNFIGQPESVLNFRSVSVDIQDSPEIYLALSLNQLPCVGLFSFHARKFLTNLTGPGDVANEIKDFCVSQGRHTLRKFVEQLSNQTFVKEPFPMAQFGMTIPEMSNYAHKVSNLSGLSKEEKLGKLRRKIGLIVLKDPLAKNRLQAKIMILVLLEEIETMQRLM